MKYRFREQYGAVLQKRQFLRSAGAFSEPDETGSKVAILVPFMDELVVEQELDSRKSFEGQTIMGATREDFERVLADESIPTVVVAGFGNLSAIAISLSSEGDQPFRFGYLDWLHLAGMATHLKLGKFVALQCGGYYRQFNPPLASGVQSSYQDILAPAGKGRYATGDWEKEIAPVTTSDELSYDQIKEMYPMQRRMGIPDVAYVALREVREQMRNPDFPRPEQIPYPDEMRQFFA
jgi:hypothetical protein